MYKKELSSNEGLFMHISLLKKRLKRFLNLVDTAFSSKALVVLKSKEDENCCNMSFHVNILRHLNILAFKYEQCTWFSQLCVDNEPYFLFKFIYNIVANENWALERRLTVNYLVIEALVSFQSITWSTVLDS